MTRRSEGLGGSVKKEESINPVGGVPKPVKKTFAEQVTTEEMNKRLRGCRDLRELTSSRERRPRRS